MSDDPVERLYAALIAFDRDQRVDCGDAATWYPDKAHRIVRRADAQACMPVVRGLANECVMEALRFWAAVFQPAEEGATVELQYVADMLRNAADAVEPLA